MHGQGHTRRTGSVSARMARCRGRALGLPLRDNAVSRPPAGHGQRSTAFHHRTLQLASTRLAQELAGQGGTARRGQGQCTRPEHRPQAQTRRTSPVSARMARHRAHALRLPLRDNAVSQPPPEHAPPTRPTGSGAPSPHAPTGGHAIRPGACGPGQRHAPKPGRACAEPEHRAQAKPPTGRVPAEPGQRDAGSRPPTSVAGQRRQPTPTGTRAAGTGSGVRRSITARSS
ncbi:hypothetical protein C8D87_109102 [Lentzea atacamensis]|uniref:Uncharacterized protein n=1 Tax=Lentzea atacamensis TaxID=531938 RepID=A0ABX9E3B0_9PSEU|nr:hypothetical protein C8D87_109102 [Lentzea atacamensis]